MVVTKINGVEAWMGDGQGRWSKASIGLPVYGFYYGIMAADINLDGFADIVAGTNDQKGVRAWLGNGKGEWKLSSEGLPDTEHLCSIALVDFNEDGKPDIIGGDYNGIRPWLQESPLKKEYSDNLPVNISFDITGQPDIMFGRNDGIVKGWTGDEAGKWTETSTDLLIIGE